MTHNFKMLFEFELGTPKRPIQVWCLEYFGDTPSYMLRVNLDNEDWLMEKRFTSLTEVNALCETIKKYKLQSQVLEILRINNFSDF